MSRGFVKEGDQEEIPLVPPRAALPEGVPNYVTPTGYKLLLKEKENLEEEKRNLPKDDEDERRRSALFIDGKLALLNTRIASARILENDSDQDPDEVRFGAIVEFYNGRRKLKFQIVGVDEADIKQKKIAFTAPIARTLIGKHLNEEAEFKRENQVQKLKILKVVYPK